MSPAGTITILASEADDFFTGLGKVLAPVFAEQRAEWAEHGPAAEKLLKDAAIELDFVAGNCPVQAEGMVDGERFYFRARGEHWALHIGAEDDWFTGREWRYEEAYGDKYQAGWMPHHEALCFISQAVGRWRAEKTA